MYGWEWFQQNLMQCFGILIVLGGALLIFTIGKGNNNQIH